MNSIYRWLFAWSFLLLFHSYCHGQVRVAIQNLRGGAVYTIVDNLFAIAIEGFTGKYLVETDNGTVHKDQVEDYYEWRPAHTGRSLLVLRKAKSPHDTLWKALYKVVDFPAGTPSFLQKKNGDSLSYMSARLQIAPAADIFGGGSYGCGKVTIVECNLVIIRGSKVVLNKTLKNEKAGVRFSDNEDAQKAISTLMPKDILLFNRIKARGPGGKVQDLSPMVFNITD